MCSQKCNRGHPTVTVPELSRRRSAAAGEFDTRELEGRLARTRAARFRWIRSRPGRRAPRPNHPDHVPPSLLAERLRWRHLIGIVGDHAVHAEILKVVRHLGADVRVSRDGAGAESVRRDEQTHLSRPGRRLRLLRHDHLFRADAGRERLELRQPLRGQPWRRVAGADEEVNRQFRARSVAANTLRLDSLNDCRSTGVRGSAPGRARPFASSSLRMRRSMPS